MALFPAWESGCRVAGRAGGALFALPCAGLCLYAAAQHPVAPMLALSLLAAALVWAMWRPVDLWFVLPALLPVASFAPWTGWWLVDESDLLVLALGLGLIASWR